MASVRNGRKSDRRTPSAPAWVVVSPSGFSESVDQDALTDRIFKAVWRGEGYKVLTCRFYIPDREGNLVEVTDRIPAIIADFEALLDRSLCSLTHTPSLWLGVETRKLTVAPPTAATRKLRVAEPMAETYVG